MAFKKNCIGGPEIGEFVRHLTSKQWYKVTGRAHKFVCIQKVMVKQQTAQPPQQQPAQPPQQPAHAISACWYYVHTYITILIICYILRTPAHMLHAHTYMLNAHTQTDSWTTWYGHQRI